MNQFTDHINDRINNTQDRVEALENCVKQLIKNSESKDKAIELLRKEITSLKKA